MLYPPDRSVFLALFIFVLSGTSQLHTKPLEDRELAAKLVGTWMPRADESAVITAGGIITFRVDGTEALSGSVTVRDKHVDFEMEGNWRIEKGILIEVATKSSLPQVMAAGHVSRSTIVAISDDECWLRDEASHKDSFLIRYKR